MVSKILTAPDFPGDDEKSRVAQLLHWIVLAAIFLNCLNMALLAIYAPETIPTFWINGILLAATFGAFWMMRRGMIHAASYAICIFLWGSLAFYIGTSGGVTSPAFSFLSLPIIVAAVLLGGRGVLIFGILSIASAFGLYYAYEIGWMVSWEEPPTPARMLSSQVSIFASLAVMMAIGDHSIRDALARARKNERMLCERNQQLQTQIELREKAQCDHSRLLTMLENTSDLVALGTLEGRTLYLNRAGHRLMGWPDDLDLSTLEVSDYHPPEIVNLLIQEAIPTAMKGGIWSGETILKQPDGTFKPVSQVIMAHNGTDGKPEYLSTTLRDLSMHKQAEQQRLELAVQRERHQAFKEFMGNISHDLKTPLAIINTSLYVMEHHQDPDRRKEKMHIIGQQMTVLEKYIQDILTLSRLDAMPEPDRRSIDMSHLLDEVYKRLAPLAQAKRIALQTEPDAFPRPIHGDQMLIYRMLTNLLENAIHYTPDEGAVTVKAAQMQDGVSITVEDNGIGIRSEDLPHIFERYYRSRETRESHSAGTGLGLAIVKRVVDIHGGTIALQSQPNEGTRVSVWLPDGAPIQRKDSANALISAQDSSLAEV